MSSEKKNILLHSFTGLVIFSIVTFSSVKNYGRKVEDVAINIEQEEGNYFTDQFEVSSLMTMGEADYVLGSELSTLNPKVLETRVESNPFIAEAQIYRDLKGNLKVNVIQSKPIARIFDQEEEDKYIDEKGNILPVHAKHTARVPMIEMEKSFRWEANLNETTYGERVLGLLKYIESDPFWKAQIAHLILKKNGEVVLLPQVTKQRILLGYPEDLNDKFKKLMVFYKQILPAKGWNSYSKVSLKYENQIVCE